MLQKSRLVIGLMVFFTATGNFAFAEKLPEYFGVYARYNDGTLIELEKKANFTTQWRTNEVTLDQMSRLPAYSYVMEKPKVVLDMSKVDAFFISGEQGIAANTAMYYFTDAAGFPGKFFENRGPGGKNENTFINVGETCGPNDGMKYKKVKDGLYQFAFPVSENEGYKFCDLIQGKTGARGAPISFYGWFYNNQFWTFLPEK